MSALYDTMESFCLLISFTQDGKAEVIANEEGGKLPGHGHISRGWKLLVDRLIPSMISYIDGEEYHGTQAKSQLVRNANNTVAYFRDFLGKE